MNEIVILAINSWTISIIQYGVETILRRQSWSLIYNIIVESTNVSMAWCITITFSVEVKLQTVLCRENLMLIYIVLEKLQSNISLQKVGYRRKTQKRNYFETTIYCNFLSFDNFDFRRNMLAIFPRKKKKNLSSLTNSLIST